MSYLIVGFMGVFAGIRALGLRRRQMGAASGLPPLVILRPPVLVVLAGIAIAGGLFLLAAGVLVLV